VHPGVVDVAVLTVLWPITYFSSGPPNRMPEMGSVSTHAMVGRSTSTFPATLHKRIHLDHRPADHCAKQHVPEVCLVPA
jgi:hypothetical protein